MLKNKKQTGIVILPFVAAIVGFGIIGTGIYTYNKVSSSKDASANKSTKNQSDSQQSKNFQSKNDSTQPPKSTDSSTKPKNTQTPKPKATQPPPAQTKPFQYLSIDVWGVKIQYNVSSKNLNYRAIDANSVYMSSEELDNFAKSHPQCPDANQGAILLRMQPGDSDYYGQVWDAERLQSVKSPKIGNYYYLKNNVAVCTTSMPGVDFNTQQAHIELLLGIPFHDAVVSQ